MKVVAIMEDIAKKRAAILSGGRIDYEKVSGIILDEFRSGKIGKITIEKICTVGDASLLCKMHNWGHIS